MKITYYSRSVYGSLRHYVSDPVIARMVQSLIGQTTVSDSHLAALAGLGHDLEQVIDPALVSRAKYGVTLAPPHSS